MDKENAVKKLQRMLFVLIMCLVTFLGSGLVISKGNVSTYAMPIASYEVCAETTWSDIPEEDGEISEDPCREGHSFVDGKCEFCGVNEILYWVVTVLLIIILIPLLLIIIVLGLLFGCIQYILSWIIVGVVYLAGLIIG